MAKHLSRESVLWKRAPDIKKRVLHLIKVLDMDWISSSRLHFVRSDNSTARAYARIWGLSKVWQMVLDEKPSYIIEVINEKYERLSEQEKDKVLLHELAHIPKNFSGSLLPHIRRRGKRNFQDRVEKLFYFYKKLK